MGGRDESKLETMCDVILEYNKGDFYDRIKEIEKKNKGKLKLFGYDITPLKEGRTMYFVQIRYQVYRRKRKKS